MSHRLIHARPETTHGSGRVDILHISKEKRARRQTRRSGAIWGKMLRMRRTQFSDRVHICAKWRRRRLSTTETRRDLVKLFSAGESLSPVPGFDRGSCVPPDPRSNYAAGLILRMGPAAPCYLTVEAPPQQPLPLPPSLSLRDVVRVKGENMLGSLRLFGVLARESRCFSWRCAPRSCEYCITSLCSYPMIG